MVLDIDHSTKIYSMTAWGISTTAVAMHANGSAAGSSLSSWVQLHHTVWHDVHMQGTIWRFQYCYS